MIDYTQLHTRALLALLQETRTAPSRSCLSDDEERDLQLRVVRIKAELATREHIPTKAEAKAIRQLRARTKCR